ncbi:hypothetical protein AK812_SmicGene34112 [Symbiodinium microadriaticum]|uniref:CHASE domain-containing protein n=1 Tax=Symbiodinium microadriaticum TaxID=2951 RepID=A0A1Q9CPV3_SYMMI|nr:hypothetical protein AK812_SmicGene34112 [Symbiodinium microadriaticum]
MGEEALALQRGTAPAALAAIVQSQSDMHDIPASPSISEPGQQQMKQIPLWMRWRKFWGVLAIITAIVAVSIWNLSESEASLLRKARQSVRYVARTQAGDITRQLRTSFGSLQALDSVIQIDRSGAAFEEFDKLAETLIRTYKGISNLQLAPFGTICCVFPLVDASQDNRGALGHALLLDPARKVQAFEAIQSRQTHVNGPLKLLQGGIGAVARRPIFARHAPQFLPDEWWLGADGVNYTRICSVPELRDDQECSIPGPVESDGSPTYFWGFATMLFRVEDLLSTTELAFLETGVQGGEVSVSGISQFAFELSDPSPHPSMVELGGIWLQSTNTDSLSDAVQVSVALEEFALSWILKVAPLAGWPMVSEDFWRQLLLVLPLTAVMGVLLGLNIILALRRQARALQDLARHLALEKCDSIRRSVRNLDTFLFPMCLVELPEFLQMGQLVRHEVAREAGQLRCFESHEADGVSASSGTVFVSHQWAGFDHPDPEGRQYSSILLALQGLQERGIACGYIWVDYTSIPQVNEFQQQAAVNSLAVYASRCSVLVAVAPTCTHADTGAEVNLQTYGSRGWCRLELLSYKTGSGLRSGDATIYICDDSGLRNGGADESLADQSILHVLGGSFTCCSREHPDNMPCDRHKIRDVLLGIYWRLSCIKRDGDLVLASWAREMLQIADTDTEKYFPSHSMYRTASGAQLQEHFDGYLPLLREMFATDSEQGSDSDRHAFVRGTFFTV